MSVYRKILAAGLVALATASPLLAIPAHAATTQPLNVAAIGDSYASGEGDIGSGWIDPACQRSAGAAPERAASQLNGIRTVNFTSFACEGSVIDPAEGNPPPQTLLGPHGQLAQVDPSLSTPVDALTISIGGNDIGFANIVEACAVPYNSCSTDPSVTGPVTYALNNVLPFYLDNLINTVNERPDIDNVFLTAYPDPTAGPSFPANPSGLCGQPGPDPGFEGFDFISQADAAWASSSVIAPLNKALQTAVTTANAQSGSHAVWHFVSGISTAFAGHGFCTGVGSPNVATWITPRYVSTPADSQTSQGDLNGSMHPNDLGQQAVANVIYNDYVDSPLMSASVSASSAPVAESPSSFTVQDLTFANVPVANASVLVDGNLVGYTNSSGVLNVSGYVFPTVGDHTIVTQAAGYPDAHAVLAVQVRPYTAASSPSPIPLSNSIPALTLTATDSATGQLVNGTFTLKTGAGTRTLRSGAAAANVAVTILGHTTITETIPGPDGKPITITVTVQVCPTLTFQSDSSVYAPHNFSTLISCRP